MHKNRSDRASDKPKPIRYVVYYEGGFEEPRLETFGSRSELEARLPLIVNNEPRIFEVKKELKAEVTTSVSLK